MLHRRHDGSRNHDLGDEMNRPQSHPITASPSPVTGNLAGAVSPLLAAPATFSPEKLLEDARRFKLTTSETGELDYLHNIISNLLRVPCGTYAEQVLRDCLSDIERASENEAEDRRWNGAERIEL